MTNIFSLILVIATLVSGLLWCFNKFIYFFKRFDYNQADQISINNTTTREKIQKVDKLGWMKNGGSVFPVLAIILIVRSFIYEPFQIPSGSMMPTLLIGDFILVEKFAYGIKDPIYQKTLIRTAHPKRGDIVIFKYPEDPRINYIKRVICLPGDKITYNSITKELCIYTDCNSRMICNNELPITYSNVEPINFAENLLGRDHTELTNSFSLYLNENEENSIRLIERKETLGNVTHSILISPLAYDQIDMYYHQYGQPIATWIVPPGCYFMMGDNRDNSADSRYWGFVPEENLIGKATAIWISFKKQENKWPTGIRLDRIGRIY